MANTQTTTTPTAAHRGASPIPALIVGLALLVFWVLASMLQIQTSEAFILKGPVGTLWPHCGLLQHPLHHRTQKSTCPWHGGARHNHKQPSSVPRPYRCSR